MLPDKYASALLETPLVRRIRGFPTKRQAHFMTWQDKYQRAGGTLDHLVDNYARTMMGAGDIADLGFFENKIVLDVGSGPACTLCWIPDAKARIGIDPLSERFMELGIASHDMIYINAPAEEIPLPSGYVDVVFSINSLDHVEDPSLVMNEINRVLRPGGHFIGSIGLKEEPTFTEPHVLTRSLLRTYLFQDWTEEFSKVRPRGATAAEFYRYFFEEPPSGYEASEKIWWCRFRKP